MASSPKPDEQSLSEPVPSPLSPEAPSESAPVEEEAVYLERERQKLELQGLSQDIAERKAYAGKIFRLVVGYLVAVFLVIFGCGLNCGFSLPDSVLLMLLGTTTANILALMYIVAKYLFPSPKG